MRFSYHLPVNLIFGPGRLEEIGPLAAVCGRQALLVTGRGSTRKSGLLERVIQELSRRQIGAAIFDQVDPNPTTAAVSAGVELARAGGCDFIIGLGGGSSLDAAKAIAFSLKNDGDLMDYIFGRRTGGEALPLLLVPTTCGTGSEGNSFAVITDAASGDKKSLRSAAVIARAAIIDPLLMTGLPKPVLAAVGFDAFSHCLEAYLAGLAQPLTDLMALEGLRLAGQSLVRLYQGAGGESDWENLCWASTLGGMCIGQAGVAAPHALEHPVSGLYPHVAHGHGLAALTPVIMEKTIPAAPARFAAVARLLGGRDERDFGPALRSLLERLGLKLTLGELGVREKDLDWLTENAFKVSAVSLTNHPAAFDPAQVREIYKLCL